MAVSSTRADLARLTRQAELAGHAFAFDDAARFERGAAQASAWVWWLAGLVACGGLAGLGLS